MGRGHVRPKAEPSDDATSQGTTLHRRFQREQGLGSGAWPPELREGNCSLAAPVCVTGYGSPEHSALRPARPCSLRVRPPWFPLCLTDTVGTWRNSCGLGSRCATIGQASRGQASGSRSAKWADRTRKPWHPESHPVGQLCMPSGRQQTPSTLGGATPRGWLTGAPVFPPVSPLGAG